MADDGAWIDEAAMQSMYQDGNQPSRPDEIQLYKQLTGEGIPTPRPRPGAANKLSDQQMLQKRAEEIQQYELMMREYEAREKRKGR